MQRGQRRLTQRRSEGKNVEDGKRKDAKVAKGAEIWMNVEASALIGFPTKTFVSFAPLRLASLRLTDTWQLFTDQGVNHTHTADSGACDDHTGMLGGGIAD